MMWVATEEGLNCFDGNKFRQFRNAAADTTSLCSNFVNSLFENEAGQLIVCTNRGMQCYDRAGRRFSPRIKDEYGNPFTGSVMQVIPRGNGDFWIVGDSVKIISSPGKKKWDNLRFSRIPRSCGQLRHVHCGITDKEGNLWLSRRENGLLRISPDNKVRKFFGAIGDPSVLSMALGKDGQIYLGTTSHGLLRFNSDNGGFESLSPSTGKAIQNLYVDRDGKILQATDGTGIISYDPATGATAHFHSGQSAAGLDKAKTHCILRDDHNNIWVGVFQTGVFMMPDKNNNFGYMGPKSDHSDLIGHNCISSIYKDSGGTLWVGADNDGLYALNLGMTSSTHFYNNDISVPMCIFEDSRGNLWVGTYMKGVGILDRKTGNLRRVDVPAHSNMCFAITEDRNSNVWLGMMNSGLARYNLDEGKASTAFPWHDSVDSFIASLYYSPRYNTLYIGTYSGLQKVTNPSQANAKVSRLFNRLVIHSIDEDDDGIIWLATTDGLVAYNPKEGTEKRYGVVQGLNSSTAYAVRCLGKQVWVSTNNGIARLDTETGRISNFYAGDGLQGNEFYKNSVFRDRNGTIFFGGTGGVTYFNPRDISTSERSWTPRVVDIYAQGTPLEGNIIPYASSLFKLKKEQNSFSVEFGTRELGRPETVRFAYSIDGKTWETLPENANTVNFYDLNPGKHTLRFKTIDDFSESPEKQISLAIAYPWYSHPWSKLGYAIVFILIILYVIRSYSHRMRNKEQLMELRHSDQLNEARIRSYVNISHEIRTPMSLIISPLKKLIATDDDPVRLKQYNLIMRNAKRVLRLIDELMDLRRIEKRQMTLSFRRIPLVPFIQDICDTFTHTVADRNQTLNFTFSDEDINAYIDAANFDKILMNLFSNAVKYTPKGGRIDVNLSTEGEDAIITVTDNGIGIPPEHREHIFERFYRVNSGNYGGTGVGLHLSHQLASLHGGSLTVESNPEGKGSRFILRVPLRHSETTTEIGMAKNETNKRNHTERILMMDLPGPEPKDEEKKRAASADTLLIVEDDEDIRNYLASELGSFFRVETCSNGREALDIIFKSPPSIILSDVMMPEIDGIQLTKTVKQNINLNRIPIVLVSALTRDEDNINAISAGADDYFTKPFNIEVLKERMKAIITRYRELKNLYEGNQEHDDQIDDIEMESVDDKLIRKVVKIINDNLDDPELSVEKLATEVGLSRVHLHRKLKALTNQSPSDFIRNTRLRQAASLLKDKKISVAEAAFATGFNSASTFSIAFKRLFGVTPSAYSSDN